MHCETSEAKALLLDRKRQPKVRALLQVGLRPQPVVLRHPRSDPALQGQQEYSRLEYEYRS